MAKIVHFKELPTVALEKLKADLLFSLHVPINILRASCVQQYLTCGKKNCRCRRGHKHGPFQYLVQSVRVGKVRKFLLKTERQKKTAEAATEAYVEFQKKIEELSQINTELLQRGEVFEGR